MSDRDVSIALDAIERLLAEGDPQAEALAACQGSFDAALATAERGPEWPALTTRARGLSERLNELVGVVSAQRDQIKRELLQQGQGSRALKAYKPR